MGKCIKCRCRRIRRTSGTMPDTVRQSLARILLYLWNEEEPHCRAKCRTRKEREGHIFGDVERVTAWLDRVGNRRRAGER